MRGVKSMPSQSQSQRRWPSGSRRKSAASMTGAAICAPARCRAAAPAAAGRCRRARRPRGSGRRTRPPRPGRGSAARCGSPPSTRGRRRRRGGAPCAWRSARSRRPAAGRAARRPTSARSVVCEASVTLAAGVVDAGAREERRVERLVDDDGVGPVLPGAHHRRGDVARAAPHGDPHRHVAAPLRPATSASTRSTYRPWRRSTIGPRPPVPMVRPSTVRTGTTPANVPVTKASRAL